jgi:hypothetical protein
MPTRSSNTPSRDASQIEWGKDSINLDFRA